MASIPADSWHADGLRDRLHKRGFTHLRVRKRGAVLTIESGDQSDPHKHARMTRDTVHLWRLDMATHRQTWERTPHRATLDELVELMAATYPWTLEPIE